MTDTDILPITAFSITSRPDDLYHGHIIATGVTYDDWLQGDYGPRSEWIFGTVIDMSPVTVQHEDLCVFLRTLLGTYLELREGGRALGSQIAMRPGGDFPAREPDVMVLLPYKLHLIREAQVVGAADVVVEVVSAESITRDYEDKFDEYQRAEVREYWIIDPLEQTAAFYGLDADGQYERMPVLDMIFASRVLNGFTLLVDVLWRIPTPTGREAVRLAEQMTRGN